MRIIKGFYQDTIKNKTTSDLNIDKARVVMIDCDLKESTELALEFIRPAIQEGTIILFDDYNFFKGNKDKGEYGAFSTFQKKYPKKTSSSSWDPLQRGKPCLPFNWQMNWMVKSFPPTPARCTEVWTSGRVKI